jgi:threonine/homoserine/homoserine lactone efflux protein
MTSALLLGISYGFAAGVSPGPLLGLVLTQSLRRGWRAGSLVALAPLLTDLPIIVVSVLVIQQLPPEALDWLAVVGGVFVLYLAFETIRGARRLKNAATASNADTTSGTATWRVLGRAVVTNALSPHPYLFWAVAGAQLIVRSGDAAGPAGAAAFLVGFYALLVGMKLLLAQIAGHSRDRLRGRTYRGVLIASGLLLGVLGALLLGEGALALL